MLIPTTAPDRCAMKLGWGPEDGNGGEKRSQTARPTSELTEKERRDRKDRISVEKSLQYLLMTGAVGNSGQGRILLAT